EYRWAEGRNDRLPTLAAELVRRQVTVIVSTSTRAVLAARTATTAIPTVFFVAADPVQLGLVTSLSRPGGNLTGVVTLHASSEREVDAAFATLVQLRAGALVIGADSLFTSRSEQLATLTIRHRVPAIYQFREFVSTGGLMAYGSTVLDTYRPLG